MPRLQTELDMDLQHRAFADWVKRSGLVTDWTRFEGGYAKPITDRMWRSWLAAVEWSQRNL